MDQSFWYNVLTGIATLALASIGLAVVFGIMKVVNFAHGEFITAGAFGMWFAAELGLPGVVGFGFGAISGALVAFVLYLTILRRLIGVDPIVGLLATWAFGIAARALVVWVLGPEYRYVPPVVTGQTRVLGAQTATYNLVVLAICVVGCAVIWYLYTHTRLGKESWAVSEDAEMAAAVGLDVRRVHRHAVVLSGATAGLAGALLAPLVSVGPMLGLDHLVRGFLVVLVGGLGGVFSVFGGAAVMGTSESVLSFHYDPVLAQVLVFVIVALLLIVRPKGLFTRGREDRWQRP